MKLSDDKINELSHQITEAFSADSRVTLNSDFNVIRLAIRRSLGKTARKEMDVTRRVEQKIRSQKREIIEGSAEWEALYWQYYEDEIVKLQTIK